MKPRILDKNYTDIQLVHNGRENLLKIRDYFSLIGFSQAEICEGFLGDPRGPEYSFDTRNHWWISHSIKEEAQKAIDILWEDV